MCVCVCVCVRRTCDGLLLLVDVGLVGGAAELRGVVLGGHGPGLPVPEHGPHHRHLQPGDTASRWGRSRAAVRRPGLVWGLLQEGCQECVCVCACQPVCEWSVYACLCARMCECV